MFQVFTAIESSFQKMKSKRWCKLQFLDGSISKILSG
jgi:hypothetical protein